MKDEGNPSLAEIAVQATFSSFAVLVGQGMADGLGRSSKALAAYCTRINDSGH